MRKCKDQKLISHQAVDFTSCDDNQCGVNFFQALHMNDKVLKTDNVLEKTEFLIFQLLGERLNAFL